MIRPVTFCTMLTAALSGAYLFGVKHRAQMLDNQLAAVTQEARLDVQRIAVLQAQWSLEIDHRRLQALTVKFSRLQAMKPAQLVTLSALAQALPPAGSAAPEANPVAPMPVLPEAPEVAAVTPAAPAAPEEVAEMADAAPAAENSLPLPPPVAPPEGLAQAPEVVTAALPPAHLVLAHAILAGVTTAPGRKRLEKGTPRVAAKRPHFEGSELAALAPALGLARPVGNVVPAKLMAVNAVSDDGTGQGGSMLGMAADLSPPQPLAPGTSN